MIRRVLPEEGQDIDSSNNDNDRSPDHHDVGDVDEHEALEEKSEEPEVVQEVEIGPQEPHGSQEGKGSPEGHIGAAQEEERISRKADGVQEEKGSFEDSDGAQEEKGRLEET